MELQKLLQDEIREGLYRITISGPRGDSEVSKVRIRPVEIKGKLLFQCQETVGAKEFHKNMTKDDVITQISDWMNGTFKQMQLEADTCTASVLVSKKGTMTIKKKPHMKGTGKPVNLAHNRKKRYILEEGIPVPFLQDLGVMTKEGKIVRTRYDKFRQINRFLEFIEDILPQLPSDREITILDFGCGKSYLTFAMYYYFRELKKLDVNIIGLDLKEDVIAICNGLAEKYGYEKLHFYQGDIASDILPQLPSDREITILDFGCGKSYLTFAMYYYFRELKKLDVNIIGLDLKEDVIAICNGLAEKYGYEKLHFYQGDIASYTGRDEVDMVVTLHACDTATDYALEKAVKWNAKVILSVPCCQHELNRQIANKELYPIMDYGILKERMAALLTDGIRAKLLENAGYETQILEFIDMEHTPKNLLIRAVKRQEGSKKLPEELKACMEVYHVKPTLADLLTEKEEP